MVVKVIERIGVNGVLIEILEYEGLKGNSDPRLSERLFYASRMGLNLRQVKVTLDNGLVLTEAGSLNYSHGNIISENKIRSGGFKRVLNTVFNNEGLFRPSYRGTGEVYLEPSFKHYKVLRLSGDSLVLDEGMFYCATQGVDVSLTTVKNVSSALFGSDGLTQTVVSGNGLVVIEIPVPESEIREIILNNTELKVDGNFAIMRTSGVRYGVAPSSKGVVRSWLGGNGLVESFSGVGTVWIAPTVNMYHELSNLNGVVGTDNYATNGNGNPNPQRPGVGSGGIRDLFNGGRGPNPR